MSESYLRAGAIGGLVVVALVGFLLLRSGGRLRAFLADLVGPEATKWALALLWFAYAYSAVSAAVTSFDFLLIEPGTDPTAVAFGRGALSQALLPFLDRFVGMAQVGVLALAALLFYQGVRAADRGVRGEDK